MNGCIRFNKINVLTDKIMIDKNQFRYFSLAGVAGPGIFVLALMICASLYPGYSHIHQLISELGAKGAPTPALMNYLGFITSGVMISVFGLSLMLFLPGRILLIIGSSLIFLFGAGVALAGVFKCDTGCPPHGSFENMMHFQISGPSFLFAYLGIFLLGMGFRKLPFWNKVWVYSTITSILALAFNLALIFSLDSNKNTGLWQRMMLLTIFLWTGIIGIKLYQMENSRHDKGIYIH